MSEETPLAPLTPEGLHTHLREQYQSEIRLRITRDVVEAALRASNGRECHFQLLTQIPHNVALTDLGKTDEATFTYLHSIADKESWTWIRDISVPTRCVYIKLTPRAAKTGTGTCVLH